MNERDKQEVERRVAEARENIRFGQQLELDSLEDIINYAEAFEIDAPTTLLSIKTWLAKRQVSVGITLDQPLDEQVKESV